MLRSKVRRMLQMASRSTPAWTAIHLGTYRAHRAPPQLTAKEDELVQKFSDLYYSKIDGFRGLHTIVVSWLGYEMFKCPLDLWVYQELIYEQRPPVIVETGTYKGGSALYLATVCDLIDSGEIITIDIDVSHVAIRPQHPRITYLSGSSVDPEILQRVEQLVAGRPALIILDADHREEHVLAELRAYRRFVPVGGYMVVEDTNINGHPTYPEFGPGPWEAVDRFLAEDDDFEADRGCERFLLTMNPRGFLRRER